MPEVAALNANLLLMSFLRLRQKRSDPLRSNPSRSAIPPIALYSALSPPITAAGRNVTK